MKVVVVVESVSDIVAVARETRCVAEALEMSSFDETRVATAAMELARNMLQYGGGGRVTIDVLQTPAGVRLVFEDTGPGIADLALAFTDGYSSAGSLGLGLGGAKRLTDRLTIRSVVGSGTTITMVKWRR